MDIVRIPLMYDNRKIGKEIRAVPVSTLPINEIFYTLEGEGLEIGRPRILCRVGGCAVGCTGCDSVRTWTMKKSNLMSLSEVVGQVVTIGNVTEVSITGGEPMEYPQQLEYLVDTLHGLGYTVSLETSGTIISYALFKKFDKISLDIKTPSAKIEHVENMFKDIFYIWENHQQTQVKVVVTDEADLMWIQEKVLPFIPEGKELVLTPAAGAGATAQQVAHRVNMIVAWNRGYRVRIIPQVHVLLNFR